MQLSEQAIAAIEKVKKLLALAQNNDNEHQAAAAAAKAQEILDQFNLDMAVLGKSAKGKPADRNDTNMKGGLYGWQRDLWKAVAELNHCMYWSIRGLTAGSVYEHRILGSHANVIATQVMADYLQGAVERLARNYGRVNYPTKSIFIKELIAYREGATRNIAGRLQQLRRERLAEDERRAREEAARAKHPGSAGGGTALVLADVIATEADLNNDYIAGLEPGTHARWRAEREARQAAFAAEQVRKLAERDAAELADPSLKEKRLAEEAKRKAEDEKWYADYLAKAKKAGRRKESEPRTRKATPQEERARMHTFGAGYRDGDKVSLNQQIDKNKQGRLK